MTASLKQLIETEITAQGGGEGFFPTRVEGLMVMRLQKDKFPRGSIYKPCLCVVVQGAKQLLLGDAVFDYRENQALIVTIDVPAFGRVTEATPDTPFLAVAMDIDLAILRAVMTELPDPPKPATDPGLGLYVDHLDDRVLDCLARLVELAHMPDAIGALYPAIMREICYWLLMGRQGSAFARLALPDGHARRIADAIRILNDNIANCIRVEQLADTARMSPSSFHQHFKNLTGVSPLQYQKHLRLLEARRRMLDDGANASDAAYGVGYESLSQFSREYTRMFGAPPKRDVTNLRALLA